MVRTDILVPDERGVLKQARAEELAHFDFVERPHVGRIVIEVIPFGVRSEVHRVGSVVSFVSHRKKSSGMLNMA